MSISTVLKKRRTAIQAKYGLELSGEATVHLQMTKTAMDCVGMLMEVGV